MLGLSCKHAGSSEWNPSYLFRLIWCLLHMGDSRAWDCNFVTWHCCKQKGLRSQSKILLLPASQETCLEPSRSANTLQNKAQNLHFLPMLLSMPRLEQPGVLSSLVSRFTKTQWLLTRVRFKHAEVFLEPYLIWIKKDAPSVLAGSHGLLLNAWMIRERRIPGCNRCVSAGITGIFKWDDCI